MHTALKPRNLFSRGAKKEAPSFAQAEGVRFLIDEQGCIAYASPDFQSLTGKAARWLQGRPLVSVLEFANPDTALRAHALFGAHDSSYIDAINEGTHEVHVLDDQNTLGTCALTFTPITTPDGKRYILGADSAPAATAADNPAMNGHFAQQITNFLTGPATAEDHPAPKVGAQSDEAELRHFLSLSNDLMAVSARDGSFQRVNDLFLTTLGYEDSALRHMTFMDFVHEEDRASLRNSLFAVLREEAGQGRIIDFEARLVSKSGKIHHTEWRQKRSGNLVYSVGRDVTAVKTQEAALRTHQAQLDEAQAIGHMGHWRWTVGADDIEFSDEIYRIFGLDRAAFAPTLENINAMLHRRDLGRLIQAFQRAIIEQNNYDMDFRITRPSGETRYIRCEGKCELDHNGEVIALFGIMQDITQSTQNERDLREAKEAVERAYAAKSQFLANMSHELRTPLNAIIGFSEMMQRQLLGPIGTEKYLDYIAGIRESGEHLLDLISDILDMSKIEAGKYELDLEEINAAKVIKLAAHMMEGRANDAKIRIALDIENEDRQIVADRRAVMQIMLNLLSNAVKFSRPNNIVRVECRERDTYLSLKIIDNGIGIPANKIKCITHPFEQAANHYTREHEGTGLGLAITKDLTELHGGTLHIESTVDVGTTVTVRLPFNAYERMKAMGAQ